MQLGIHPKSHYLAKGLKSAKGMASNVKTDQTAQVISGSTLLAEDFLSE